MEAAIQDPDERKTDPRSVAFVLVQQLAWYGLDTRRTRLLVRTIASTKNARKERRVKAAKIVDEHLDSYESEHSVAELPTELLISPIELKSGEKSPAGIYATD